MTNETQPVSVGDREVALGNEILRVECGSGVHGMAIPGTDDHDEMGVYVETPAQVVGIAPSHEHYTQRSKPQGVRSEHGDTDLSIYGLRKWTRLAVQGNPTVLVVLYAPEVSVLKSSLEGLALLGMTSSIISMNAGHRFLGYLEGQRERMLGGGKQSRVPNRPELIAKYGWDTKYASHALRLGLQGIELVSTGRLSLPLRPDDLEQCMAVKRGEVSFATALTMIDAARADLAELVDHPERSPLPARPDMVAVNDWLEWIHRLHWDWVDVGG